MTAAQIAPFPREHCQLERLDSVLPELTAAFAATAAQHDRDATFPTANIDLLHRHRLLALTAPKELGGLAADLPTALKVVRAVAKGEPATALVLVMQYLHLARILDSGWPTHLAKRVVGDAVHRGALINSLRVEPDHFWVNPAGVFFGHVNVSSLLLVNHDGEIVHGSGRLNRAAFAIHSELHKARPDVIAAAHSHGLYGKTWSTLGRLLDPLTQDSAAFYNDHVLFDDYTGVVLDSSEGERIAATLGPKSAAILQNHGLLTVGQSVDGAVWRYIAFENAAHAQLLAEAAGTPKPLTHEVATHTQGQVGRDAVSWFSFQPLFDFIAREEPDLFE